MAAKRCDVVIMCMGLNSMIEGEEGDSYNGDLSGDKADIELPTSQRKLYEEISKLNKPMVFINVSGSCINLREQEDRCAAVVQCFYPGAEGGNALADILFGKVSPTGRLPVTFYDSLDGMPKFSDYSMENRTYKFYGGTPVYAFGHVLTYNNVVEEWLSNTTVRIKNRGKYDIGYKVLRYEYFPHKSLGGFKKVNIKANEEIVVVF